VEVNARSRGHRPQDSKARNLVEAMRPLCESSLPGMARYVRARLRHHGYPSGSETLTHILQESYESALTEISTGNQPPRPAPFRKSLTDKARTALHQTIEQDQKAYLADVVDAYEHAHADAWKGAVPARTLARLARTVLEALDTIPSDQGRIILRALLTGTHTTPQVSRLLDMPDLAPTLAHSVTLLSEELAGRPLPGLPGLLHSLKEAPGCPPAAMLGADPQEAAAEGAQRAQRAAELHVMASLPVPEIARRLSRSTEVVNRMLSEAGLLDGTWAQVGPMAVDMVAFTRELEVRDLAAYVDELVSGGPAGGGLHPPVRADLDVCGRRPLLAPRGAGGPGEAPASWKLFNRRAKRLVFWMRSLLARICASTFGPGLTGPWVRARLAEAGSGVADLRGWLAEGGLAAASLGALPARTRLAKRLETLLAPRTPPPGPDLTRPLTSPPAAHPSQSREDRELARTLLPRLDKLIRRSVGS
jgi:hypothetical protein